MRISDPSGRWFHKNLLVPILSNWELLNSLTGEDVGFGICVSEYRMRLHSGTKQEKRISLDSVRHWHTELEPTDEYGVLVAISEAVHAAARSLKVFDQLPCFLSYDGAGTSNCDIVPASNLGLDDVVKLLRGSIAALQNEPNYEYLTLLMKRRRETAAHIHALEQHLCRIDSSKAKLRARRVAEVSNPSLTDMLANLQSDQQRLIERKTSLEELLYSTVFSLQNEELPSFRRAFSDQAKTMGLAASGRKLTQGMLGYVRDWLKPDVMIKLAALAHGQHGA